MSNAKRNAMKKLGIGLLIFAILEALGAVWYWAIIGLSNEAGTAHTVTCFLLFFTAIVLIAEGD